MICNFLRIKVFFVPYKIFFDFAVILLATKLFGIFSRKIHMPQVIGALVAGLVLGPAILGIVSDSEGVNIFAEVGVIMLMFTAGLETDLKELKKTGLAPLSLR